MKLKYDQLRLISSDFIKILFFSSEHVESISDASSTTDQPVSLNTDKTLNSTSLPQLSDDTKARILALIRDLGQNSIFLTPNTNLSPIKLAFVDKNLYICSPCSGAVQWI